VYKDPSVKGLTFRIHGMVEMLENLHRHFVFDDGGSDSNDGSHGGGNGDDDSHGDDDGGTPTN
jgi:hypothetical protein